MLRSQQILCGDILSLKKRKKNLFIYAHPLFLYFNLLPVPRALPLLLKQLSFLSSLVKNLFTFLGNTGR